ncbi:uncharacterized protein LOC113294789 [Papaver somniferum]|uniref:uncharacterized protein LOC113294789 n=1 Tax=Papaver somniferum TaxID=3469 RepID=UPI000E6F9BE2|nr:uncharacterized protein LOC113294789 [Papaver somniferum]
MSIIKHYAYWHPGAILSNRSPNTSHIMRNILWSFPPKDTHKINYDASWISAQTNAGFGFIMRNFAGNFKAAGIGSFKASSAEESEAVTPLHTVQWAVTKKIENLIIEWDNPTTTMYVQGKSNSIQWQCIAVLDEIKKLVNQLVFFLGFKVVDRKANGAADILAKKGTNSSQSNLGRISTSFYHS